MRIADALEKARFRFLPNPEIEGLRPDFFVWGLGETTYVIELKAWPPTLGNRVRAIEQAELNL
jgi:hypothetical protein